MGGVSGCTSAIIDRAVDPPPRQREIPESVKWGRALLTIIDLAGVGAKFLRPVRCAAG